jgi:hypothetical protein
MAALPFKSAGWSRGSASGHVSSFFWRAETARSYVAHKLVVETCEAAVKTMDLAPRTVADFCRELMSHLRTIKN